MQFIDDDIIISTKFSQLHKKRALMMKSEYAGLNPFKVIEGKSNVYLMYKNTFLNKLTKEAVDVEIVNIKDDNLIIEGGFRSFADIEKFEIIAKVGMENFHVNCLEEQMKIVFHLMKLPKKIWIYFRDSKTFCD